LKTYTEQLEEVRQAIMDVMSMGQAVVDGEKRMTRADLDTLQRREAWLEPRAARERSKGKRNRVSYVVPM